MLDDGHPGIKASRQKGYWRVIFGARSKSSGHINLIARCRDARKSKHIATLRTDMNVTHSLIAILALIVFWRITHPVAPASSLPAWQQLAAPAALRDDAISPPGHHGQRSPVSRAGTYVPR